MDGITHPAHGRFVGSLEYEIDYDSDLAKATQITQKTLLFKLGYQW